MGRTSLSLSSTTITDDFNSLAPCGANLYLISSLRTLRSFQLTRPVWGEPDEKDNYLHLSTISTHSPRVGRTRPYYIVYFPTCHFNSLAPCGANQDMRLVRRRAEYFNSLAPCGANLLGCQAFFEKILFQLTRPVWGEPELLALPQRAFAFQLTRPVWGEPKSSHGAESFSPISTHSPRVGRT